MRVISVDPAPGKPSTWYSADGDFRRVPGKGMRSTLASLEPPVLLCWDAPLTGPRNPEAAGCPGDFTKRRLENFFTRKKTGFKVPTGISVGGYASLQHWTISRSVLGLPRVGPYDAGYDSLPFHLLPAGEGECRGAEAARMDRSCVVETHPAVAAWLWRKDEPGFAGRESARGGEGWRYKGSKRDPVLYSEMWDFIRGRCDEALRETLPEPEDDDQFDAIVGYVLAEKWLRGDDDVVLLGDRANGAMLLPRATGLCEAWKSFRDVDGS